MKVLAFNGSPRKNWNTAILLHKAMEGAVSQGAETEFIHLNDLNYKGCQSCFTCKIKIIGHGTNLIEEKARDCYPIDKFI